MAKIGRRIFHPFNATIEYFQNNLKGLQTHPCTVANVLSHFEVNGLTILTTKENEGLTKEIIQCLKHRKIMSEQKMKTLVFDNALSLTYMGKKLSNFHWYDSQGIVVLCPTVCTNLVFSYKSDVVSPGKKKLWFIFSPLFDLRLPSSSMDVIRLNYLRNDSSGCKGSKCIAPRSKAKTKYVRQNGSSYRISLYLNVFNFQQIYLQ